MKTESPTSEFLFSDLQILQVPVATALIRPASPLEKYAGTALPPAPLGLVCSDDAGPDFQPCRRDSCFGGMVMPVSCDLPAELS